MLMESPPHNAAQSINVYRWTAHPSVAQAVSKIREFLRWWRDELLSLVPPRMAQMVLEPRLRAEVSASEVCIYGHDRKLLLERVLLLGPVGTPLAHVEGETAAAAQGRCDALLEPALVLESPLTLPLEAERELRRVLTFSMDRYTPFSADEVYFDYRVQHRDMANRKIDVLLYVATRKVVDGIVGRLAQAGLETMAVDVAAPESTGQGRLGINLLPARSPAAIARTTHLNTALGVLLVLLLLSLLLVPLWKRHQSLAAMEDELRLLVPQVQEVERVQSQVQAQIAWMQQIQQRKKQVPPVLDILLELTRLVPDEAWASQVEIRDGRVKLTGEAQAASSLMQTLTVSGYFFDPRFEAPLTQNPKSERERFTISLAVKGHGSAH